MAGLDEVVGGGIPRGIRWPGAAELGFSVAGVLQSIEK
jgi:hypothetical protein